MHNDNAHPTSTGSDHKTRMTPAERVADGSGGPILCSWVRPSGGRETIVRVRHPPHPGGRRGLRFEVWVNRTPVSVLDLTGVEASRLAEALGVMSSVDGPALGVRIVPNEDGFTATVADGRPTWRRNRSAAVHAALSDALPSIVAELLEDREVRIARGGP